MDKIEELLKKLEYCINNTPTGNVRTLLTDCNIIIKTQQQEIDKLKESEKYHFRDSLQSVLLEEENTKLKQEKEQLRKDIEFSLNKIIELTGMDHGQFIEWQKGAKERVEIFHKTIGLTTNTTK